MKKILIIGAQGMLGQELVNIFKQDNNYKIVAWDKDDLDIIKEKEVTKKIGFTHPNIIINAAAYNDVDKCEKSKKEFDLARKINGLAPGYLAKVAQKEKAILVHYSSDYVFDGQPEIPEPEGCSHSCSSCALHNNFQPLIGFDEMAKPHPINKYGETKLMGEEAVMKNTKKYYLIRLSWLFGKPAKAKGAKRSFFDIMLELGKKEKEVKVVDDEMSSFTYAPDLAKKTKEIIDAQTPFGIYHIVNSQPASRYEAVLKLYQQEKIKTKVLPVEAEEFPTPAQRPPFSVLLNTKLNPLRDWNEALKEYLKDK